MLSNQFAILSLLLSIVAGENAAKDLKAENVAEETIAKWEPLKLSTKPFFFEQFTEETYTKDWVKSKTKKEADKDGEKNEEILAYSGEWSLEEPKKNAASKGDLALVLKSKAKHHAISTKFKEPIDFINKPLVLQYEVKMQEGLECGGAYLKLLTYDKDFKPEAFHDKTPYTVMFGPDRCGNSNKVHFIFRHFNPITKKYEEKHLVEPPFAKYTSKYTTLYTLVVNPNNTFEILVDQESVKSGNLLENFNPPVNPPKEISDPSDSKPADWVDDEYIPDPNAVKPDDWDESAPEAIPDPNAKMPEDWLVNEPLYIPDPDAVKPEDWNDEEDGDFIPGNIPNPKCNEVSGCGEWTAPIIPNPDYKGLWLAPDIKNPAYKGPWEPRKIPNPDYFEDLKPSEFNKVGALGFELWTMQNDILFDNIYLGNSKEEADEIAKGTWKLKNAYEKSKIETRNEDSADKTKYKWVELLEGVWNKVSDSDLQEVVDQTTEDFFSFAELVRKDFGQAFLEYPNIAGLIIGFIFVVWIILGTILNFIFSGKPQEENGISTEDSKKRDITPPDEDEDEDDKNVDHDQSGGTETSFASRITNTTSFTNALDTTQILEDK